MTNLPPLRVLSLDGGGMRGTYTATYIDRVAAGFAKRKSVAELDVGAAFDLIVGTSTGGIIACALAAGVRMTEIVELYVKHGPEIFNRPIPASKVGVLPDLWKRSSAIASGADALRDALAKKLETTTFAEIYEKRGIGLAIPAVEMSQHRSWVFKTPHLKTETNHRDDNYSLVDACMATTAAPIFRSMAAIDHPDNTTGGYNVFVDGGLWANNPVLVGLIDALDLAAPDQEIQIFCLGTCPLPAGEQIQKHDVNRGLAEWEFGSKAAELSIDAQQFAYDNMAKKLARHLNRKCSVIRFPADKVPAALIPFLDLDETRPDAIQALINQARTDADMTNSKCAYAATDPDAAMICALFEAAPPLTDPLATRASTPPRTTEQTQEEN